MDVSLNIPKATRTMKTTNIALKTTIKMLPRTKTKFQIFEILRGFRVIFEKVVFFENSYLWNGQIFLIETLSSISLLNLMNNQHKLGGRGHCFKPVMPKIQKFYFFKNASKIQGSLKNTNLFCIHSGNFIGLFNGILFVFILPVVLEFFKITQLP